MREACSASPPHTRQGPSQTVAADPRGCLQVIDVLALDGDAVRARGAGGGRGRRRHGPGVTEQRRELRVDGVECCWSTGIGHGHDGRLDATGRRRVVAAAPGSAPPELVVDELEEGLGHRLLAHLPRPRNDRIEPLAHLGRLRDRAAARRIYANHYFSATLELRTLVDDDDGEDDGFFLLYATRSRVSGLSGFFKGLLRAIVKRRARSGMGRYLANTQAVIEGRSPGDH